jgi:hypothetical protein
VPSMLNMTMAAIPVERWNGPGSDAWVRHISGTAIFE